MRKTIAWMLICTVFLASCAHTTANPVQVAQPGDDTKSCDAIANEMQQMINAKATAEGDRNAQVGKNVALGIAGIFLIVPWFFMDTGNAATVEERAAQARYLRLQQMQADKKCPAVPGQPMVAVGADGKAVVSGGEGNGSPVSTNAEPGVASPTSTATPTVPAAAAQLSPAQRLAYLDEMLKKGLITQSEYDAKKAEILKSM